jgi:hypothetical protein
MSNINIVKPTQSLEEIQQIGTRMIAESPLASDIIKHVKAAGGQVSERMKLAPTIVFTIAHMMSQGVSFENALNAASDQLESMGI